VSVVNSYAYGSIWFGLVTYGMDDMHLIADSINFYSQEVGYKESKKQ